MVSARKHVGHQWPFFDLHWTTFLSESTINKTNGYANRKQTILWLACQIRHWLLLLKYFTLLSLVSDLSMWMITGLGLAVFILLIITVAGFTHIKRCVPYLFIL